MKVASYNIRKAVGLDRKRDPARILRVLNDIDADVVVLQEVDKRLGARSAALPPDLIRAETDYDIVDHAGSDVSLGWHGNAILVRDASAVSDPERIDLPGLEPRGAVAARVGGYTILGTHLGLLRASRNQQMQAIRDHLSDRAASSVIAGDFNEWSERKGFEPWLEVFCITRPGLSFHARRPVARLDGFATGAATQILQSGVIQGGEAARASDHLPVWARLAPTGPIPE